MTIKEKLTFMYEVKCNMDITNALLNSNEKEDSMKYERAAHALIETAEQLGFKIEYRLAFFREDRQRRFIFIMAEVSNKYVYMPILDRTSSDKNVDAMLEHMRIYDRIGYSVNYSKMKIADTWN